VTVEVMLRGSDGLLLELLGIDAEDARLLVVQPNDGLMSIHWQVAEQSARQPLQQPPKLRWPRCWPRSDRLQHNINDAAGGMLKKRPLH
jgi:hypothetical protein